MTAATTTPSTTKIANIVGHMYQCARPPSATVANVALTAAARALVMRMWRGAGRQTATAETQTGPAMIQAGSTRIRVLSPAASTPLATISRAGTRPASPAPITRV